MAEETRSFTRDELTKLAEKAAMKGAGLMADEMAPRIVELEAQLAQAHKETAAAARQTDEAMALYAALFDEAGAIIRQGEEYGVVGFDELERLAALLANPRAAASKLLAAQRVAEACDAFRKGDAPRVLERVAERKRLADAIDEALEIWRKAAH